MLGGTLQSFLKIHFDMSTSCKENKHAEACSGFHMCVFVVIVCIVAESPC